MKIINDPEYILMKKPDLSDNVIMLKHEHYKYMWSLKRERNSNIRRNGRSIKRKPFDLF